MTDERRQQILEAAAGVIAERGICDARIADVAERIGISPALILYYFPSKDVLLAQALAHRDQQFFDQVEEGIVGATTAVERLQVFIEVCIPPSEALDRDDNEWQLWLEMWSRSRHDRGLAAERQRMDDLLRGSIHDIVVRGIAEGTMTCADPVTFSLMLSSLIDGLAIQVLLQDPSIDYDRMKSICCQVVAGELSITDWPKPAVSTTSGS